MFVKIFRAGVLTDGSGLYPDDEEDAKRLLIAMLDPKDPTFFLNIAHKFSLEGLFVAYLKKALEPGFWLG